MTSTRGRMTRRFSYLDTVSLCNQRLGHFYDLPQPFTLLIGQPYRIEPFPLELFDGVPVASEELDVECHAYTVL